MTQQEIDIITVCIYAGLQQSLHKLGMVDDDGKPLCKPKSLTDEDAIYLYASIARRLPSIDTCKKYATLYNVNVNKLVDDFNVNNFYLVLSLYDRLLVNTNSHTDSILIEPKIRRLCKYTREQIGSDVAIDSTQAANNLFNMLLGKKQITKKEREEKVKAWRGITND